MNDRSPSLEALQAFRDKVPGIAFGGDYNADQWPSSIWPEDIRLMREAGVNLVSLAVFCWASLEPAEGDLHLAWLDEVMDLRHTAEASYLFLLNHAQDHATVTLERSGVELLTGRTLSADEDIALAGAGVAVIRS